MLMSKVLSKVVVELQGGLGNRLFQLFAGLSAAKDFHSEFIVDVSLLTQEQKSEESYLESLCFEESIVKRIQIQESKLVIFWRFISYLSRRSKLINLWVCNLLSYKVQIGTGYEFLDNTKKQKLRINGYFQSWKYINSLEVKKPTITSPSNWYTSLLHEVIESTPIILHIRLGDYLNHRDSIGLLNVKYYEEALTYLRRLMPSKQVWVFSNDIKMAKIYLNPVGNYINRWITPSLEAQSSESLMLMTQGSALVLSNSTYSWWAGFWASENSIRIVPETWFRNLEAPLDLIPESWIRLPSYWEE